MREEIIKVVSSIIICAGLSGLHRLVNAKRLNRRKQMLLPVVSLVFAFAAVFIVRYQYNQVIRPLEKICGFLRRFIEIDPLAVDVLYINVVVYTTYVLGRIIPFAVSVIAFAKKNPFEKVLREFYKYDENSQQWLLLNKWTNLRTLFKWLMYASIVVSGVVLGCIWQAGSYSDYHIFVTPVVFLLVVTEIYLFLNGITEFEYEQSVVGDDSYANKIKNLYVVREIFEKIFGHELLTSETRCDYTSMKPVIDYLEELEKSDSTIDHKIAQFFKLNGDSNSYDADYISATLKLLNGDNVVFYDPFYRDLGKYLILPMLHTLLSTKKVLIISGRESVKEDLISWVKEILVNYGKIEDLWRVRELDFKDPECEVGVLGFNTFYNPDMIQANELFFKQVGLVIMLEPSLIVNTGQIGLSILADYMLQDDVAPTYCFLDRINDGLVDSLSHVLQINITEVEAPPVSRNNYTSMTWDADGDYLREKLFEKQTTYLGNGIELASVAIKNQVPEVDWYSETKVPIKDIKWLAGQYFSTICKYMNRPTQQESLYECVKFHPDLWSAAKEDYKFVFVEDEFRNMFNTLRLFLSRGEKQTFINVFSENYLLRDYMRCNKQMFVSNPDVIPSIVPDYAKTARNTLIKLVFLMSTREVDEEEIVKEFSLVGINNDDANSIMTELLRKYLNVGSEILKVRAVKKEVPGEVFCEKNLYSITYPDFNQYFRKTLKNAFFICEDEDDVKYIDAKLFGHITQVVLPGQYVVYEGKYYIVHSISSETGVVLRRASNLYDGRKYYRQIREYTLEPYGQESIISSRTVMDIELVKADVNFSVKTKGYLELNKSNDLRTARVINFEQDPNVDEYAREFHNKTMLRIKLPDADTNVIFTIAMLLSETLKSVFPNAWEYLAVTTKLPEEVDGMLNYLVYDMGGSSEDGYIYVFEDSELDLGLLEAVEKNLIKFVEIITDFLIWHFEKMREPAHSDAVTVTPEFPAVNFKRRSKFLEMARRIASVFGGKKEKVEIDSVAKAENKKADAPVPEEKEKPKKAKKKDKVKAEAAQNEKVSFSLDAPEEAKDETAVQVGDAEASAELIRDEASEPAVSEETNVEAKEEKKYEPRKEDMLEEKGDPDLLAIDGTDIFDETGTDEDNEYLEECFVERGLSSHEKSRYQQECFLKFGFNEIDNRLKLQDVIKYLTVRGFSRNAFRKARTRNMMEESLLDLETVNHCDFCGRPISMVSYERLDDGRIRCNDCAKSAVNTVEEFREIFKQSLSLMQSFFDINFSVGLNVSIADARKIARGAGSVYVPSTQYTARVLGYAKKENGKYEIYIENGSPRMASIVTMVHELTHIWQYKNWKDSDIRRLYRRPEQRDIVYEGMAIWTSIQYLYLIGEYSYARDEEMMAEAREDVYGIGFRMFREKYPLIKDSSLVHYSPFNQFPPL